MKTKLLVLLLLVGTSLFAGPRVFVGIGVGGFGYGPAYYAPPPPPPVAYVPPIPAPGYNRVAGYWYPVGPDGPGARVTGVVRVMSPRITWDPATTAALTGAN